METAGESAPDFGVLLAMAHATFVAGLHRHMAAAGFPGFSTRAGFVLRVLGEDALSLRELADRLEMSSPAALKVIEAMAASGLVERTAEPDDRRVRAVRATGRGREALATARAFHAEAERELAQRIGGAEAAAMRAGLAAVVEHGDGVIPASLRRSTAQL